MRAQRTLLNWRWWVALPIFLLILPLAAVSGAAEWTTQRLAKLTTKLVRWTRAA